MGSALAEQASTGEKFLDMMPKDIVPIWESLSNVQKASIIAQGKLRRLETEYQINDFWATRGLRENAQANVEMLNESQEPTNNAISNDYMQTIAAELGKRFKK